MRIARAMIPAALLAITAVSSCTALKAFAAEPAPMDEAGFDRTFKGLQSATVLKCLDPAQLKALSSDAQIYGARQIAQACAADGW